MTGCTAIGRLSAEAAVEMINFEAVRDARAEPRLFKWEAGSLLCEKDAMYIDFSFKHKPELVVR